MSETGGQEIAFGDALDAFPSWQSLERDLGIRVSGWRINRGRVDETQRTGTGTATIFVNDLSGYFGPGNDYPTHARLLLRDSPRFRGHVNEINVTEDKTPAGIRRVSIECVDMFDYLSRSELIPGIHGHLPVPKGQNQYVYFQKQQVDDRIIDVLSGVGILSGQRSIFSGNVEVQQATYPYGTTAMQVLDETVDAEWPGVANRFIDSTGRYCFRGRFARFNPGAYPINFWEAGTRANVTTGRAQIRELSWTRGRNHVYNSAQSFVEGTAELDVALIVDADSIGQFGRLSWSAENLLTRRHLSNGNTGADEAVLFSTYQVANYKSATPRITSVRFISLRDFDHRAEATWDLMCGVEIGDVLDVFDDAITGRYFVEGITMEAHELNGEIPYVICDLDLSPAAWWTVDPF